MKVFLKTCLIFVILSLILSEQTKFTSSKPKRGQATEGSKARGNPTNTGPLLNLATDPKPTPPQRGSSKARTKMAEAKEYANIVDGVRIRTLPRAQSMIRKPKTTTSTKYEEEIKQPATRQNRFEVSVQLPDDKESTPKQEEEELKQGEIDRQANAEIPSKIEVHIRREPRSILRVKQNTHTDELFDPREKTIGELDEIARTNKLLQTNKEYTTYGNYNRVKDPITNKKKVVSKKNPAKFGPLDYIVPINRELLETPFNKREELEYKQMRSMCDKISSEGECTSEENCEWIQTYNQSYKTAKSNMNKISWRSKQENY